MTDIFISHVEEDATVAIELAEALEGAGFTTWYYERDSLPGISYLIQIGEAVDQSTAVVVLVSRDSLGSHQVTAEVVRAYEARKPILPVTMEVTHMDLQRRQPEWRTAIGALASVAMTSRNPSSVIARLIAGLNRLGIEATRQPQEQSAIASAKPSAPPPSPNHSETADPRGLDLSTAGRTKGIVTFTNGKTEEFVELSKLYPSWMFEFCIDLRELVNLYAENESRKVEVLKTKRLEFVDETAEELEAIHRTQHSVRKAHLFLNDGTSKRNVFVFVYNMAVVGIEGQRWHVMNVDFKKYPGAKPSRVRGLEYY